MANIVPRGERGHLARRNDPFSQFENIFDAFLNRMLSEWAGPSSLASETAEQFRLWDFNVDEEENQIVVRAEMPGFEPDDIDLRVEDNQLNIRAEERHEAKQERQFRSFFRSLTLPAGVDPDRVEASYHNGVLEVRIPRSEVAKPKRIQIQRERSAQRSQSMSKGEAAAKEMTEDEKKTAAKQQPKSKS
jgi:HSP20 family protein